MVAEVSLLVLCGNLLKLSDVHDFQEHSQWRSCVLLLLIRVNTNKWDPQIVFIIDHRGLGEVVVVLDISVFKEAGVTLNCW